MDGATAAAMGAWEAVRGFFTPATLFLVLNLVIGTILLTSRSQQRRRHPAHDGDDAQHEQQQHQPLQQHEQHHQDENQYYNDQQQEQQYVPPPPEPAPLARTSSVLDRLRSIGLYRFRSGDFPPEYTSDAPATDSRDVPVVQAPASGDAHHARSRSEPALEREERRQAPPSRMKKSSSEARRAEVAPPPAARVVQAAVLEEEEEDNDLVEHARMDEFTDSFTTPQPAQPQEEEEQYYQEEYVPPYRPAPLARAPSVLDRLRSFSLYRFRSGDLAPELDAAAAPAEEAHATHYSRSRSEPAREQDKKGKKPKQAAGAKMSKSSSKAPEEAQAEEGGVDARADDFINSFRKQLQLQRLNSLLNYKEMLNRGA